MGTLGTALETIPYSYGDSNWKDKLTAYNGQGITYDAIGNPLNDGTWTYNWQAGRQLAQMSKSGTTVQYQYDANGLRVGKTVNGTETTYTLHGKLLMHLKQGANEMHFYYDAQSRPAMANFNGAYYMYLHNLQGDVVGLVDNSNNLVVEYKYDAWGRPTLKRSLTTAYDTLATLNPFRYRGYVYDEETGLYYLRSRYYSSIWNRFINGDFILDSTSIASKNIFIYCANSPIFFVDPYGTAPEPLPSRPLNWDAEYLAQKRREELFDRITQAAQKVANIVSNAIKTVKDLFDEIQKAALMNKLEQSGGAIIFEDGTVAHFELTESLYTFDTGATELATSVIVWGITKAAKFKNPILQVIGKFGPKLSFALSYLELISVLRKESIKRAINTEGSIGYIYWSNIEGVRITPWFTDIDYFEEHGDFVTYAIPK